MHDYQVLTEDMLQQAFLGGIPCRAYAYVEVTHIDVPADERGRRKIVEGIRTWRGAALLTAAAFPARWKLDQALRYDGTLIDGTQERHISADVYVYETRRARLRPGPAGEAVPQQIYVAFVGAGNGPLHAGG